MTYKGVARGQTIDLDEPVSLPEGTRVTVQISPEAVPPKGSPLAVLTLAGTLALEEADRILAAASGCRRVDEALWGTAP